MPKKTLPRQRKDYVWAHPYGVGPFSPVLYADGGAGDGGGSGSSSSGTGGDGGAGDGGQGGAGAGGTAGGDGGQGGAAGGGDVTDWQAEARKWEKRAKDNFGAVGELDKLKAANMSEQEKAVTAAEKAGRTAARAEAAPQIAQARLEAAAARSGVDLSEFAEFIDLKKFVGEDGEVDDKAIKAAVTKFSKLAPAGGPGRSGGDFGGGSGDQATSLDKQIEEATTKRDFATVIRLKRQKAAQTT